MTDKMKKTISIVWSVADVKYVRPDLDETQCSEVLEHAEEQHDSDIGITWDVLETHADYLFPMERITHNQVLNFKKMDLIFVGWDFEEIDATWKTFITPKEFAKR
jgi:hypothetical protein